MYQDENMTSPNVLMKRIICGFWVFTLAIVSTLKLTHAGNNSDCQVKTVTAEAVHAVQLDSEYWIIYN